MDIFSEREQNILAILGRKRLSLEDIANELFKENVEPFDANILIANSIRRIIKKCSYYKLDWTLIKTRSGNKLIVKRSNNNG